MSTNNTLPQEENLDQTLAQAGADASSEETPSQTDATSANATSKVEDEDTQDPPATVAEDQIDAEAP